MTEAQLREIRQKLAIVLANKHKEIERRNLESLAFLAGALVLKFIS